MAPFKFTFLTAFGVFLFQMAPTTFAQDPSAYEQEKQEYQDCIAESEADPEIAHVNAMTWRDTGGGLPARHCVALSLASLGRYAEAAVELEIMASDFARGIGGPLLNWASHSTATCWQKSMPRREMPGCWPNSPTRPPRCSPLPWPRWNH